MQAISVSDTATGVQVTHRTLPALLRVVFFSGALAFAVFVLAGTDLSEGSWLPPLDRLPEPAKYALIILATGAGLAIMIWPLVRGLRILLFGEVWEFDAARRHVTRNGKIVAVAADIKELRLTGDFRGDTSDITLDIVTRTGRTIEVAEASLDEAEYARFLDIARRVRARMQIPYETVSLPPSGAGIPGWWHGRA